MAVKEAGRVASWPVLFFFSFYFFTFFIFIYPSLLSGRSFSLLERSAYTDTQPPQTRIEKNEKE